MVRRKPGGRGIGTVIELLRGRQGRWKYKLIWFFGNGWGSRLAVTMPFPSGLSQVSYLRYACIHFLLPGCWWVHPGMGLQATEGGMFIAAL